MEILSIIGNGLDIAHNMKTSYQDFFNYYLALSTEDSDIIAMKEDIKRKKFETWADLEIGMGVYSSQCANKEIFLKCLSDIKTNLKEYLRKESEKISLYKLSSVSGFEYPGSFLEPEPRDRYDRFCSHWKAGNNINIISLNYTHTMEYLLNYKGNTTRISANATLSVIQHVHGTLDEMMVMGVNDSSQISNTEFNTDEDVVEEFIKPEYNDACMNNKNSICESLIQRAGMIVLYGTSLGKSDDKWWKLIGQRMPKDNYPLLVYLPYDEKKDQRARPNHLLRWTKQSIHEIREKFDIQLDEKILAQRVCVAFNKRLFQITKNTTPSDKIV